MKVRDLIKLSSRNLWRRKLRTFLTILGVLIGTTSIVVMVSIAIGQTSYFYEVMNQNNELTTIEVYPDGEGGRGGFVVPGESDKQDTQTKKKKQLTLESVEELASLDGVRSAYPVLNKRVFFKTGPYENSYQTVVALPEEGLADLKVKILDKNGEIKPLDVANFSKTEVEFLFGGEVKDNFYKPNSRGRDYRNPPQIDPLHDNFAYYLDPDSVHGDQQTDEKGNLLPTIKPKRRLAHIVGELQKRNQFDYRTSYQVYTRLEPFVELLKKEFRGRGFEGQKKTKSGRWRGDISYSNIIVRTKSLEDSQRLVDVIKSMGYQANSAAAFINEMQKQQRRSQFMFGSIGAIALFVAAIGIANTMMMAIYERTKEIGVFKVLGCPIHQIRNMFLIEAGAIGFFGGVIGLLLSTLLSYAINNLPFLGALFGNMGGMGGGDVAAKVSVIPFWLYGFALLFATSIGMLAGLFPALRAMKLSALEALRTE